MSFDDAVLGDLRAGRAFVGGAYSPDLRGCVAAGRSRDEVETLMSGAVEQQRNA